MRELLPAEREVLSLLQTTATAFASLGGHDEHDLDVVVKYTNLLRSLLEKRCYEQVALEDFNPRRMTTTELHVRVTNLIKEHLSAYVRVRGKVSQEPDYRTMEDDILHKLEVELLRFVETPCIEVWKTWQDGFRFSLYLYFRRLHLLRLAVWCERWWPVRKERYEVLTFVPSSSLGLSVRDTIGLFNTVQKVVMR